MSDGINIGGSDAVDIRNDLIYIFQQKSLRTFNIQKRVYWRIKKKKSADIVSKEITPFQKFNSDCKNNIYILPWNQGRV